MGAIVTRSERLVVADKGFFGLACLRTDIGDKICYLLGCTKVVVLREVVGIKDQIRDSKGALGTNEHNLL
jgi:hypothetical protein